MMDTANTAGIYESKSHGLLKTTPVPKIQMLTLKQILNGERPNCQNSNKRIRDNYSPA